MAPPLGLYAITPKKAKNEQTKRYKNRNFSITHSLIQTFSRVRMKKIEKNYQIFNSSSFNIFVQDKHT
jgi:hypothetical protein